MVLSVGMAAGVASADIIKIKNSSSETRTLSDLFAFSKSNNTGVKTTLLKKGDASDDINIAAGGTKNIEAPAGTDSFTISWMKDGKEVEADYPDRAGVDVTLAMFISPGFGGDVAVAFDDFITSDVTPVPAGGFLGQVVDGTLVGSPEFEWFTFYDTSASDGFIDRDADGVPISPRFTGDAEVAFNYVISPAPGSLALLGLGGLVAVRRRR